MYVVVITLIPAIGTVWLEWNQRKHVKIVRKKQLFQWVRKNLVKLSYIPTDIVVVLLILLTKINLSVSVSIFVSVI